MQLEEQRTLREKTRNWKFKMEMMRVEGSREGKNEKVKRKKEI